MLKPFYAPLILLIFFSVFSAREGKIIFANSSIDPTVKQFPVPKKEIIASAIEIVEMESRFLLGESIQVQIDSQKAATGSNLDDRFFLPFAGWEKERERKIYDEKLMRDLIIEQINRPDNHISANFNLYTIKNGSARDKEPFNSQIHKAYMTFCFTRKRLNIKNSRYARNINDSNYFVHYLENCAENQKMKPNISFVDKFLALVSLVRRKVPEVVADLGIIKIIPMAFQDLPPFLSFNTIHNTFNKFYLCPSSGLIVTHIIGRGPLNPPEGDLNNEQR